MPIGQPISEELRRQASPLADIQTTYVPNIPFKKIFINNYRHNKSEDYLRSLGASIANNGLLQEPGLIERPDGNYDLAFGQCRVLACRDYLNESSLRRAKVWPSSALPYIKTIALIENMDREDTTLMDEIAGLHDVLETEYKNFESPILGFCEQTGRNIDEIRNKLKIYETASINSDVKNILEQEIIKDYKSLYNLSVAIESVDNKARGKRVAEFIQRVKTNKVTGSMRKATEELRKYAKGRIDAKALPDNVTGAADKPSDADGGKEAVRTKKPTPALTVKQVESFANKLDQLENIDQGLSGAMSNLLAKLNNIMARNE